MTAGKSTMIRVMFANAFLQTITGAPNVIFVFCWRVKNIYKDLHKKNPSGLLGFCGNYRVRTYDPLLVRQVL